MALIDMPLAVIAFFSASVIGCSSFIVYQMIHISRENINLVFAELIAMKVPNCREPSRAII